MKLSQEDYEVVMVALRFLLNSDKKFIDEEENIVDAKRIKEAMDAVSEIGVC